MSDFLSFIVRRRKANLQEVLVEADGLRVLRSSVEANRHSRA
jgi:hypothetical protein